MTQPAIDLADPPYRLPGYVFSRAVDGCWGCRHQRLGGWETFLGWCGWFLARGQAKKAIPAGVVDVGCKLWEGRHAEK